MGISVSCFPEKSDEKSDNVDQYQTARNVHSDIDLLCPKKKILGQPLPLEVLRGFCEYLSNKLS